MSDEIYGRGLSYPLRLDATGLSVSAGPRKVQESIRLILGTQYGERLMRPTFGSNLRTLAFAANNSSTANLARYYVAEGLARWEPRIQVLEVTVENVATQPMLVISITYRLRATQDVHNLVYPFYLEPAS
ncbi:GPW/gp25 family protein [Frankia sp. CiP3]|uniref:GPW/gp25 family protein n=1 Tax=Frankia sp. CiP3 TaxID=2880971 RepID=UPI001EF62299|nr:GPW/gp25 family protein [Frankia sp. CiP3]